MRPGQRVTLTLTGVSGYVLDFDLPWVRWLDDRGRVHFSRPDVLR